MDDAIQSLSNVLCIIEVVELIETSRILLFQVSKCFIVVSCVHVGTDMKARQNQIKLFI